MEDKNALDSFMSFKTESVSAQIHSDGPSYISLIKSRYAVDVKEQRQDNYHAKMAYEAWHDEFIKSNPDQRNDENLLKQADCHLANEVNDAYDMEDIVMVSSPMHINISAQLRLSGKLKVDNFYIDGEGESLEEFDECGYMPSGVNSSVILVDESESSDEEEPVDIDLTQHNETQEIYVGEMHIPQFKSILPVDIDQMDSLEHIAIIEDSVFSAPVTDSGRTRLQQAYQAEQSLAIETLSCSESSDDEEELIPSFNAHNYEDTECIGSEENMADALREFQKYSPRYRDIKAVDLLSVDGNGIANVEMGGISEEVTRWYDDVEEFISE